MCNLGFRPPFIMSMQIIQYSWMERRHRHLQQLKVKTKPHDSNSTLSKRQEESHDLPTKRHNAIPLLHLCARTKWEFWQSNGLGKIQNELSSIRYVINTSYIVYRQHTQHHHTSARTPTYTTKNKP